MWMPHIQVFEYWSPSHHIFSTFHAHSLLHVVATLLQVTYNQEIKLSPDISQSTIMINWKVRSAPIRHWPLPRLPQCLQLVSCKKVGIITCKCQTQQSTCSYPAIQLPQANLLPARLKILETMSWPQKSQKLYPSKI